MRAFVRAFVFVCMSGRSCVRAFVRVFVRTFVYLSVHVQKKCSRYVRAVELALLA